MSLNKSQLTAVDHFNGPLLVLSGPGSGKTTVIVNRVANLIRKYHINPENILVVTFTNSAATEMKQRFINGLKNDALSPELVTFGTFHSVFFGILREFLGYNSQNIIKEWEKEKILKDVLNDVRYNFKYNFRTDDSKETLQLILKEISAKKHDSNYIIQCMEEECFIKVYNDYTKKITALKKIDFEDMLYDTEELLIKDYNVLKKVRSKYKYILIDEYQDINEIQNRVIKLIAEPLNNVFAVGDDDQAIYGFRGANPEMILKFQENYKGAGKIYLDINYRCHDEIVRASEKLINHNKKRFRKNIKSAKKKEEIFEKISSPGREKTVEIVCFENIIKQCEFIVEQYTKKIKDDDYKNVAVLYRTNNNPTMLCQMLTEKNIDFTIKDKVKNIYEHTMVMDVLAYLAIASGDNSRKNYLRIINKPERNIPREIFENESVDLNNVMKTANGGYREGRITKGQLDNIKEFINGISFIKGINTIGAISYIRYGLKYQQYMESIRKKNVDYSEDENIINIMEMVQLQAKKYNRIQDFLKYTEEYKENICEKKVSESKLVLSTIHGAKGLEYDVVFIMDVNERIIPHSRTVGADNVEEERRLFYVAMTRAAKKLYILYTKDRYGKELAPSRFIKEIIE